MRQRDCDVVGTVCVICARTVVEGIFVVVGVEGGRDAELVAIGLVVESTVEEIRGAGDGVFGNKEDGAAEVISIGEAAIEDRRIERCCDIRDGAGVCAWQPQLDEAGEGVGGIGGWEGEEDTFGGIVAIHHFNRFVEAALEEESARCIWDVLTVDDRSVGKCAVMAWGIVGAKADRKAVGRVQGANGRLLEFFQSRNIGQG